jgi:hypothetical protein
VTSKIKHANGEAKTAVCFPRSSLLPQYITMQETLLRPVMYLWNKAYTRASVFRCACLVWVYRRAIASGPVLYWYGGHWAYDNIISCMNTSGALSCRPRA